MNSNHNCVNTVLNIVKSISFVIHQFSGHIFSFGLGILQNRVVDRSTMEYRCKIYVPVPAKYSFLAKEVEVSISVDK